MPKSPAFSLVRALQRLAALWHHRRGIMTGPAPSGPMDPGAPEAGARALEMARLTRFTLEVVTGFFEQTPPPSSADLRRESALVDAVAAQVDLDGLETEALRAALYLGRLAPEARSRLAPPAIVERQSPLAGRLRAVLGSPGGTAPLDDEGPAIAAALARIDARTPSEGGSPKQVDPLTRLPLLPFLFGSFEQDLRRAARLGVPLGLIALDVDGFREVNERHGRAAGDRVLRGVARAIRSMLRPGDSCVRCAGDEFIVTVPGVGPAEIAAVLARLEGAIDRHKFVVAPGRTIHVGVSLGAATFPADGRGHDELLAVASARRLDFLLARRRRPGDAERHLRFPGRSDLPVN
jgi:diguanylate cyclase (GGDEF)-like protein